MGSKKSKGALDYLMLRHSGRLHFQSLFGIVPPTLFGPARTAADPYGVGCSGPVPRGFDLQLSGLLYATAEAVVSMACITERLRRIGVQKVTLGCADGPASWWNALYLCQLASGEWGTPAKGWTTPHGCHAYPIRKILLRKRTEVATRAGDLVRAIDRLPDEVIGADRSELLSSIERTAAEVFLNIWEHAYGPTDDKHFFACITVTPAVLLEDVRRSGSNAILESEGESRWLQQNEDGLVIEVAIGDAGAGVPATLWPSATDKRRLTQERLDQVSKESSVRAEVHQQLLDYAFDHDSTRKDARDFDSPAARLNWRGLHRCLRQTELLGGSIILASGQGRAGYVFLDNRMTPVSSRAAVRADLPGTVAVLRFSTRRVRARRIARTVESAVWKVNVAYVTAAEAIGTDLPAVEDVARKVAAVTRSPLSIEMPYQPPSRLADPAEPRVIIVHFSFETIRDAQRLLSVVSSLPAHHVAAVVFADIPSAVRAELRAYTNDWSAVTSGVPRLLLLWDPGAQGLCWQIGGELPASTHRQKLYLDLEQSGHAFVREDGMLAVDAAKELAYTYADFLSWDEQSGAISFTRADVRFDADDYASLLNRAFSEYLRRADTRAFIFDCAEGEAIQIPTGRLVRRFLSVLPMLRANTVLTQALRERLLHVLESIAAQGDLVLLADSPASYFVASTLLSPMPRNVIVRLAGRDGSEDIETRQAVLFVDVIYRGETIRRLAGELQQLALWSRHAIACIDMRRLDDSDYTIHALVKHYFDPGSYPVSETPPRILEVDATTHVPIRRVSEFTELSGSARHVQFLAAHPGLFISGLHRLPAGQMHVLSMKTSMLVDEHQPYLVDAIVDEIARLKSTLARRQRDVVFFVSPQSDIQKTVPQIARRLAELDARVRHVFVAGILVAPTTPKTIFPRDEGSLLSDVRLVAAQPDLYELRPSQGFIGVYLDDAAITGRSLQDFMVKAANLHGARPYAIIAVVLVNRLSPREVRFLNACKTLQRTGISIDADFEAGVHFRFGAIFRLQVGMLGETAEPTARHRAVRELLMHADYFDARLSTYADKVTSRMDALRALEHQGTRVAVAHPLCPCESERLSPSIEVVRLRHMLALNEQNEGVVSEILKAVSALVASRERTFISMLALEPELLRCDPLATECWGQIVELCQDLLRSPADLGYRSDALLILSERPKELLSHLRPVLSEVLREPALVTQLTAVLMESAATRITTRNDLQQVLGATVRSGVGNEIAWILTMIEVRTAMEQSYAVRSEEEALRRVWSMVARTWPHVGRSDWTSFDDRIKALAEGGWLGEEGRSMGLRCMTYAADVLLTGMSGIRWLCTRSLGPEATSTVWQALRMAVQCVNELRAILGKEWDDDMENLALLTGWQKLRQATLLAATPVRALGSVEAISAKPSVIEEYLPRLFCTPLTIVKELAAVHVPDMQIALKGEFEREAMIAATPKQIVIDFLRVLLGNMARYYLADTATTKIVLQQKDNGDLALEMTFENEKNPAASKGEGKGIPLLRQYAELGRFTYECHDGDALFTQHVVFARAIRIAPELMQGN